MCHYEQSESSRFPNIEQESKTPLASLIKMTHNRGLHTGSDNLHAPSFFGLLFYKIVMQEIFYEIILIFAATFIISKG